MGEQATRKNVVRRIFLEVKNVDQSKTHRVNKVHGTGQFISIRRSNNSTLQICTILKSFFHGSCSIDEWYDCDYTDMVDTWDRVTLATNLKGVNEIDRVEDD